MQQKTSTAQMESLVNDQLPIIVGGNCKHRDFARYSSNVDDAVQCATIAIFS